MKIFNWLRNRKEKLIKFNSAKKEFQEFALKNKTEYFTIRIMYENQIREIIFCYEKRLFDHTSLTFHIMITQNHEPASFFNASMDYENNLSFNEALRNLSIPYDVSDIDLKSIKEFFNGDTIKFLKNLQRVAILNKL